MVISSCLIDYTAIPSGKELNSIPKPPNLDNSCKSLQLSKLVLNQAFIEALSHLPSVVLDELHMNYRSHRILERDPIPLLPSAILHTLTTILVCRIKSLSFKNVYEAVTTLNTLDTDLLGSLVKMVHKCPETAVSLQCELLTDYNERDYH